jgi:hypothetical protein
MQRGFDFGDLQLSPPAFAMTVSADRAGKSNARRPIVYGVKKMTVKLGCRELLTAENSP